MSSAKTLTTPKRQREPNTNDAITELRAFDGDWRARVPDKVTGSLGRDGTCDVVLGREYVSSVHCFFERRPAGLRVTNNSKNGTWLDAAAPPTFELRPGEVFRVGETRLLAMTDPMLAVEADLRRLLGTADHARVGAALRLGASAASVALVGEPGCGHGDVAALLHACSPRRRRRLDVIRSLEDLERLLGKDGDLLGLGAIFLALGARTRMRARSPELAHGLAEVVKAGMLGVYIECEDAAEMQTQLGFALGPERHLAIPALRQRVADVPGLLQHLLGADVMEKLSEPNRKALLKYRWRGNLDELRDACAKLRAVIESEGRLRAAARASGHEHSTLGRLLEKLGLSFD